MLALDHLESADAAADIDAHLLGVFGRHFKTGVFQGEIRRRHGELDESPHLLDLFFLDVIAGIESLHLAGDAAIEIGGVKRCDRPDAVRPALDGLPDSFGADAN